MLEFLIKTKYSILLRSGLRQHAFLPLLNEASQSFRVICAEQPSRLRVFECGPNLKERRENYPTSGNVFAAMSAVQTALQNNDTAGLQTALAKVQTASTYLNTQQSFYGNVENQLTSALSAASTQSVSLQTDLSNRQDADESKAIVEMQQYTTTLQAAIAAESKMPTTTLFNDLPG